MGTSPRFTHRWQRIAWITAVLLPVVAVVLAATWLGKASQAAAPPVPAEVSNLEGFQRGFAWVAEKIKPSVVFIEVEQKVEASKSRGGAEMPDLRDLFPDMPFSLPSPQQPQGRPSIGQGSGVIVDAAGYILTNEHVVGNASKITVHLADGDSLPAQLVGVDALTDLAIIKIEAKRKLIPAQLGDADQLQVGSWAIAVGYPFGGNRYGGAFDEPLHYEPTITVGVISALNRQIQSDTSGHPFRNLVQTDAPINPGNSGGPLVNIRAQVIGINQAIFTSGLGGGNIGVGFAIPMNAATERIIGTLKGGQKVVRGRVGLFIKPLTEAERKAYARVYGVQIEAGAYVDKVEPGSPADRAGFEDEDIIISLNGRAVESQDEFVSQVQSIKPGTVITVEVLRDGKRLSLKPAVEALAPSGAEKKAEAEEFHKLGLTVEAAPPELLRKAGLDRGVRVRRVDPVSDGARAGLQPDDIITKINFRPVTDLASYRAVVEQLKEGDPVVLRIWRDGDFDTLEIPALSE